MQTQKSPDVVDDTPVYPFDYRYGISETIACLNVDFTVLSKKEQEAIVEMIVKNNALKVGGARKAKVTEDRFRSVIGESRPSTTNYDFATGEGTFFKDDRVELKQLTPSNPKAQQVKPLKYDKILMGMETKEASFWFVVKTSLISSQVSTKDRRYKEDGKLRLNGQHLGNLHEGMISMEENTKNFILGKTDSIIPANNDEWSDLVTFIGKYPPLKYLEEDLGLSDQDILSILTFVKNH